MVIPLEVSSGLSTANYGLMPNGERDTQTWAQGKTDKKRETESSQTPD